MTDNSTNQKCQCFSAGLKMYSDLCPRHGGRIQSDTPKKMMLKQDGDMLYAFDPDSFVREPLEPDTKDGLEVLRNNQMIQDWLRDPVVGYFSSSAAEIVRNLLEEK